MSALKDWMENEPHYKRLPEFDKLFNRYTFLAGESAGIKQAIKIYDELRPPNLKKMMEEILCTSIKELTHTELKGD